MFLLTSLLSSAQAADTLYINYNVMAPFSNVVDNKPVGIEIDIINEYAMWLKVNKKMDITVKYNSFSDFDLFYSITRKASKNTIGLGAITITPEKAKEVDFSAAYLKNVAFCITNGNAPDIKTKTSGDIIKGLGSMTALTIPGTNLSKYVNELKKTYVKDLKINNQTSQVKMLDEIAKNVLNFAYVDAIEFWFYLKSNPQKFLKMQKVLNQSKEELAFIMPKGSQHKALFNEFFSGPTGFKTTRNYRAILEKYVGSYMTQNMAIN
ncbi:MAG: transporter substrate-binding protein [Bacteroidetes bacterium]|nr:transporter substrate-binding protein [Bacteroidota bacterium]